MLRLVTPPEDGPVSLDEAKAHLRVDYDDDDAIIEVYLDAAVRSIDSLNRSLTMTEWELTLPGFQNSGANIGSRNYLPGFRGAIILPKPPLRGVTSVTYVDGSGANQTVDPTFYEARQMLESYALVQPKGGAYWPAAAGVTITYTAGYDTDKVPGAIKAAILLTLGGLYGQRAQINDRAVYTNPAVEALLAPFRIWA